MDILKEYAKGRRDFTGANLSWADLGGANLSWADLEGADLEGADLEGADLEGANLEGANLGGVDLRGANLGGANLGGANLGGADLRGVKNVFIFNKQGGRTCYTVRHPEGLYILAGCFWGTIDEFESAAKTRYGTDKTRNYEAQIKYLRTL